MDLKKLRPEEFSLTQEVEDGVARVWVFGELDMATVPLLETELERATEAAIVLELGKLTFMDVAGLRGVLSVESKARERQQKLTLMDGSVPVRKLFQLTGNDHLLNWKQPGGDDG